MPSVGHFFSTLPFVSCLSSPTVGCALTLYSLYGKSFNNSGLCVCVFLPERSGALSSCSQDSRLIQSVHRDGLVLEATLLEPGAAVLLRPAADAEVRQKWVAGSEG